MISSAVRGKTRSLFMRSVLITTTLPSLIRSQPDSNFIPLARVLLERPKQGEFSSLAQTKKSPTFKEPNVWVLYSWTGWFNVIFILLYYQNLITLSRAFYLFERISPGQESSWHCATTRHGSRDNISHQEIPNSQCWYSDAANACS